MRRSRLRVGTLLRSKRLDYIGSYGGLLFGVTPRDPATFVGMVVVLRFVALVAGICQRAARHWSIRWWRSELGKCLWTTLSGFKSLPPSHKFFLCFQ
jgi:hypothetical protein